MKKYIACSFVILVLFSSCTTHRYIYAPSRANVPFFTEKGDSKASVSFSTGGVYDMNVTNGVD